MREQIASALDVVIQVSRLSDGTRRITSISEVVGMEEEVVTMQEIYQLERLGVSPEGTVIGRFKPTGVRPAFARKLEVSGIQLPPQLFDQSNYEMIELPEPRDEDENELQEQAPQPHGRKR